MHKLYLTTKKFTLRPFQTTDEKNLVRWMNDPVIVKNTRHVPSPYRLKDAREHIEKNLRQYRQKNPIAIGYVVEINRRAVGAVGFTFRGQQGEVGYWLAKPYRGRGIMTAVIQTFVDYIFTTYRLKHIEAFVYVHNPASGKVLTKAGFTYQGIVRRTVTAGEDVRDEEHYTLIKKKKG